MRVDFTPEQVEALDDPLYSDDDNLRDYPLPEVAELAVIRQDPEDDSSPITGYACAHPDLTWEDEVIIKLLLDERAAELADIKDGPKGQQAAKRRAIERRIAQDDRKAARKQARDEGRYDRQQDRIEMREALRSEPRIAARIAARRSELESEQTTGVE